MNKSEIKLKKHVKKPYHISVLFNKRVSDIRGSKIKLKYKKRLI